MLIWHVLVFLEQGSEWSNRITICPSVCPFFSEAIFPVNSTSRTHHLRYHFIWKEVWIPVIFLKLNCNTLLLNAYLYCLNYLCTFWNNSEYLNIEKKRKYIYYWSLIHILLLNYFQLCNLSWWLHIFHLIPLVI